MSATYRPAVTDARILVYRYRRPLAATSAALAVLLLALGLRPHDAARTDVVLAATDIPAGTTLTGVDLSVAAYPGDAVPPGTVDDPDRVIGRTVVGPIGAGEPITTTRLMAHGPRDDGLQEVPVRLADAQTAALLSPGAVIDLVLARGDNSEVVAESALVVTVPRADTDRAFGAPSRSPGSLIVVATDRRTAVELAAIGTRGGVGVIIR